MSISGEIFWNGISDMKHDLIGVPISLDIITVCDEYVAKTD